MTAVRGEGMTIHFSKNWPHWASKVLELSGEERPKCGEHDDLLMIQNIHTSVKHGGGRVIARACMAANGALPRIN